MKTSNITKSVIINKPYANDFREVMQIFSFRFFKDDEDTAKKFFSDFVQMLYVNGVPCDQVVLDMWTGCSDKFSFFVKKDNVKKIYVKIQKRMHGLYRVVSFSAYEDEYKQYEVPVEGFFESINQAKYDEVLDACGLDKDWGGNEVTVYEFIDNLKKREAKLKGTLESIFDQYTTINDRLRYCNGHYFRFADKTVEKLYSMTTMLYKGNYFLDNAVRRGCLID